MKQRGWWMDKNTLLQCFSRWDLNLGRTGECIEIQQVIGTVIIDRHGSVWTGFWKSQTSDFELKCFRVRFPFNEAPLFTSFSTSSVHLPPPRSNNISAGIDHVIFWCLQFPLLCLPNAFSLSLSFILSLPLSVQTKPHVSGKLDMTTSTSVFYLKHLLAGISTHNWMLNSIKGNATVIKRLVSQLLLAQTPRALNRNRWRTLGAKLNTHTESPKARWQAFFLFFIYFLSAWARGMGILCQSVYWSWARSSRAPASLNIEYIWTYTGAAVFDYVKCRSDWEILPLWAWFLG